MLSDQIALRLASFNTADSGTVIRGFLLWRDDDLSGDAVDILYVSESALGDSDVDRFCNASTAKLADLVAFVFCTFRTSTEQAIADALGESEPWILLPSSHAEAS